MKRKKLLIFDVDGVLEDETIITEKRIDAVIIEISKNENISFLEAKKKYLETKKKLAKINKTASIDVSLEFGLTRKDHFRLLDSVNPTGIVKPNPNCEKMLREVSKDNYVVAYSNSSRSSTTKALKVMGIDKYIRQVFSSEDFSESKPSTKNILAILKKCGFSAKDAIFIGNSYEKDIVPAKEVGLTTILYDQFKKFKKYEGVDRIIYDLIEIFDFIK